MNVKRDYRHKVGQNRSPVNIDTDYFHQFDYIISEVCEQAVCLDYGMIVRNGEITVHTQYITISTLESLVVSIIRSLLHTVSHQQTRNETNVVLIGTQAHVVLPDLPRSEEEEAEE